MQEKKGSKHFSVGKYKPILERFFKELQLCSWKFLNWNLYVDVMNSQNYKTHNLAKFRIFKIASWDFLLWFQSFLGGKWLTPSKFKIWFIFRIGLQVVIACTILVQICINHFFFSWSKLIALKLIFVNLF